jgi:hypothetical protein
MSQGELDPSHLMQVGMGFWPSKTVLSAVELELFTQLGSESMTAEEIGARLGLHPRGSGSGRPGFQLPRATSSRNRFRRRMSSRWASSSTTGIWSGRWR